MELPKTQGCTKTAKCESEKTLPKPEKASKKGGGLGIVCLRNLVCLDTFSGLCKVFKENYCHNLRKSWP